MTTYKRPCKDKRVSKLTRESEKLRQEITELEDALILHSRFQAEEETSLQGIIRQEIGGSRWEHGGEGRMRTYRGNKDLTQLSGYYDQRKHWKTKLPEHDGGVRKVASSKSTTSRTSRPNQYSTSTARNEGLTSLYKNEKEDIKIPQKPAVGITCLNGEQALNNEKVVPSSKSEGKLYGIDALKNKVLAKARAKVIDRKGFASNSKAKASKSEKFDNEIHVKDITKENGTETNIDDRLGFQKYGKEDEISYSLSFLESLDVPETIPPTLPEDSFKIESEENGIQSKGFVELRDNLSEGYCNIHDEHSDKNLVSSENWDKNVEFPSKCIVKTEKDVSNNAHKWAVERETPMTTATAVKDDPNSRKQQRNSIGGCGQQLSEQDLTVGLNRQSHPIYDTAIHCLKGENPDNNLSDFPDLFGVAHKPLSNCSTTQSHDPDNHVNLLVNNRSANSAFSIRNESVCVNSNEEQMPSALFVNTHPTKDSTSDAFPTTTKLRICDYEVQSWLENLGLQCVDNYIDLFADHQIDISSVKLLSASRLREMGIHALGPLMKIMKGVQVLNREPALKEEEDISQKKSNVKNSEIKSVNDTAQSPGLDTDGFKSNEMKSDDTLQNNSQKVKKEMKNDGNVNSPSARNKKKIKSHKDDLFKSALSWKRSSDTTDYIDLNYQTPMEDNHIPQTVSVKEKSVKSERDNRNASTPWRASQKKSKSTFKSDEKVEGENQYNSKVVKKPPVKKINGISEAQQKYKERRRHEEHKKQSDPVMSARQRQACDKMAARHSTRQSSSLERITPNTDHQISLERSFSFTNSLKCQEKVKPNSEDTHRIVEGLLETKAIGFKEDDGRCEDDSDIKNTDKVNNLENPELRETLNLDIVRELQKQLSHIEQHLVQKFEKNVVETEKQTERDKDGISQSVDVNMNKESNERLSPRERRRQRTPRLSSTVVDNDITNVLKVGGLLSHQTLRGGNHRPRVRGNNIILEHSDNAQQALPCHSPKLDGKEESEHSTTQKPLTMTKKLQKPLLDVKPQSRDDFAIKKELWGTTDMAKGKLAMAQEYLRKIEIDKKDISFGVEDLLGEGAFSQVYRGIYQGSEVAIKQLKTSLSPADKNYFSAEVSLLEELRHPHVVMLLGVCTTFTCPVLVLEMMQNGNLHRRLHDMSLSPLSRLEFFQISRDIASGILYLHSHQPPVLHLNLKSRNVLIGLGNRAKVADFGFSKLKHDTDLRISRSSKSRLSQGSPAWMAPELLTSGEITPKVDVYSYAIVQWEMLTREEPYPGCSTFQILEKVRTIQRPPIPHGYPQGLQLLIERCWYQNPCSRPAFKEILKDLDESSKSKEWSVNSQQHSDVSVIRDQAVKISNLISETVASSTDFAFSKDFVSPGNDLSDRKSLEKTILSHQAEKHEQNKKGNRKVVGFPNEEKVLNEYPFERAEQYGVNLEKEEQTLPNHVTVNEEKAYSFGKNENKSFEENFENLIKDLSSPELSMKTISPPISINESEMPGIEKIHNTMAIDVKVPCHRDEPEIETSNQPKKVGHHVPSKSFQSQLESTSMIKLILSSAKDRSKFDGLIQKYLPSPRTGSQNKSQSPRLSDQATKKLLPLRQSLDKPQKPPKPRLGGRIRASNSENFNVHEDRERMSVKELQENEIKMRVSSGFDHDATQRSAIENFQSQKDTSGESSERCAKESNSLSAVMIDINQQSKETPVSHDLSITDMEENSNFSSELADVVPQDVQVSPCSETNSDTKEKNNHRSSSPNRDNFVNGISSSTSKVEDTPEISSSFSIHTSDHLFEHNTEVPALMLSSNPTFTKINKSKHDTLNNSNVDCDSSISTDMSVDSLSQSVTDEADSIDFSKGKGSSTAVPLKKKKKQAYDINRAAPLTEHSMKKSLTLSFQGNARVVDHSRHQGDVRGSFFLFSDFHLDLGNLNEDDCDIEKRKPTLTHGAGGEGKSKTKLINAKESKPSSLYKSYERKQCRTLSPSENHEMQKIKSKSPKGAESFANLNQMLNNKIKTFSEMKTVSNKNKMTTKSIPEKLPSPPPSLTSVPPPLTGKINQSRKNNKTNDFQPVKSGFPSKSSSSSPEVQGHSRFSLEPGLLLQQRRKLKSVVTRELTPVWEHTHGKSMSSVASILKKAMDERRVAMGDNHESHDGTTPDASWSFQD